MIPYSRKLEINKFEIILVFLKWFLLDFIRPVALLDLFEFVWIFLTLQKCSCCRKSFSENFDILYAYISLLFILFLLFVWKRKKTSRPTGPAQPASPATAPPAHAPAPPPPTPGGVRRPHASRALPPRRAASGLPLPLLQAAPLPWPL